MGVKCGFASFLFFLRISTLSKLISDSVFHGLPPEYPGLPRGVASGTFVNHSVVDFDSFSKLITDIAFHDLTLTDQVPLGGHS